MRLSAGGGALSSLLFCVDGSRRVLVGFRKQR